MCNSVRCEETHFTTSWTTTSHQNTLLRSCTLFSRSSIHVYLCLLFFYLYVYSVCALIYNNDNRLNCQLILFFHTLFYLHNRFNISVHSTIENNYFKN